MPRSGEEHQDRPGDQGRANRHRPAMRRRRAASQAGEDRRAARRIDDHQEGDQRRTEQLDHFARVNCWNLGVAGRSTGSRKRRLPLASTRQSQPSVPSADGRGRCRSASSAPYGWSAAAAARSALRRLARARSSAHDAVAPFGRRSGKRAAAVIDPAPARGVFCQTVVNDPPTWPFTRTKGRC